MRTVLTLFFRFSKMVHRHMDYSNDCVKKRKKVISFVSYHRDDSMVSKKKIHWITIFRHFRLFSFHTVSYLFIWSWMLVSFVYYIHCLFTYEYISLTQSETLSLRTLCVSKPQRRHIYLGAVHSVTGRKIALPQHPPSLSASNRTVVIFPYAYGKLVCALRHRTYDAWHRASVLLQLFAHCPHVCLASWCYSCVIEPASFYQFHCMLPPIQVHMAFVRFEAS